MQASHAFLISLALSVSSLKLNDSFFTSASYAFSAFLPFRLSAFLPFCLSALASAFAFFLLLNMSLKILLLVGAGSFLGGICRYLLSLLFVHKQPHAFPYGTLIVNILGCLLIGILVGYAERWHFPKELRLFMATGLLGGFTTFSSFSNETVILFHNGYYSYAVVYVLASMIIGIGATFIGFYMMRL